MKTRVFFQMYLKPTLSFDITTQNQMFYSQTITWTEEKNKRWPVSIQNSIEKRNRKKRRNKLSYFTIFISGCKINLPRVIDFLLGIGEGTEGTQLNKILLITAFFIYLTRGTAELKVFKKKSFLININLYQCGYDLGKLKLLVQNNLQVQVKYKGTTGQIQWDLQHTFYNNNRRAAFTRIILK